jgi:hypothetical protein
MNKFLIPFVLLNIILVYLLTVSVEVGPIIDDSCKEPLPRDFYGTMRDWHCIINNRKRFVVFIRSKYLIEFTIIQTAKLLSTLLFCPRFC